MVLVGCNLMIALIRHMQASIGIIGVLLAALKRFLSGSKVVLQTSAAEAV